MKFKMLANSHTHVHNYTLYPLRGSQRGRSVKRCGRYKPPSPRPLSLVSSYIDVLNEEEVYI